MIASSSPHYTCDVHIIITILETSHWRHCHLKELTQDHGINKHQNWNLAQDWPLCPQFFHSAPTLSLEIYLAKYTVCFLIHSHFSV